MQKSHTELVELARLSLVPLLELVDREELSVNEQRTADIGEDLRKLCEQYERDRLSHPHRDLSLPGVDLTLAWQPSMKPDGAVLDPDHPYLAKLEDLASQPLADPAVFAALALHANKRIAEGEYIAIPLRRFVCLYLRGELDRPRSQGRPQMPELRDRAIACAVEELVERHGIKAVGNAASEHEGSACAIVAEAMRRLGQRPTSFSAIEKIWFQATHEDG